jgi:hypothetical protein
MQNLKDSKSPEKEVQEAYQSDSRIDSILNQVETVGLAGLGGDEEMTARISKYEKIRSVIFKWIEENFVKEIDWGWTDPRAMTKSTLKKPGAEKICRLFNTHPVWQMDKSTWEMLGRPADTVCYICFIVDNESGKIIGEGRGAEKIGHNGRDVNKTIKNAEKCAIVDAALYTFMLSEKFTQDDGGASTQLADLKRALQSDVEIARAGIESKLSTLMFLKAVIESERHKSNIESFGELAAIRKAIFEDKLYDLSTGKRIK